MKDYENCKKEYKRSVFSIKIVIIFRYSLRL